MVFEVMDALPVVLVDGRDCRNRRRERSGRPPRGDEPRSRWAALAGRVREHHRRKQAFEEDD